METPISQKRAMDVIPRRLEEQLGAKVDEEANSCPVGVLSRHHLGQDQADARAQGLLRIDGSQKNGQKYVGLIMV